MARVEPWHELPPCTSLAGVLAEAAHVQGGKACLDVQQLLMDTSHQVLVLPMKLELLWYVHLVVASVSGSVLPNLLPILGLVLMIGNMANSEPTYSAAQAKLLAYLLFISTFDFLCRYAMRMYTYVLCTGPPNFLVLCRSPFGYTLHENLPSQPAMYDLMSLHEEQLRPLDGEYIFSGREAGMNSDTSTTERFCRLCTLIHELLQLAVIEFATRLTRPYHSTLSFKTPCSNLVLLREHTLEKQFSAPGTCSLDQNLSGRTMHSSTRRLP